MSSITSNASSAEMTRRRGSRLSFAALLVVALSMPGAVAARDASAPAPEVAATGSFRSSQAWTLDLGLSYLSTTGNSETNSLGFDGHYTVKRGPWGLDATASAIRASEDGATTAENYDAAVRGSRDLNDRLAMTAGLSYHKDRLAGIDLRTEANVAVRWTLIDNDRWTIHTLAGPSWVREEVVAGGIENHLGALLQVDAAYTISEAATASARISYLPNLEDSTDYRAETQLGLQAAINRRLAMKLGYLWLFDNQPVPGFDKSDTRTTASLVVRLGARKGESD
jgi:putative salt-induced outer membrane protein YdiY